MGAEPVAESDDIFFSEEFGTYTVTITEEKSKGSANLIVENGEYYLGANNRI